MSNNALPVTRRACVCDDNVKTSGMFVQELGYIVHFAVDDDPAILFRYVLLHLREIENL